MALFARMRGIYTQKWTDQWSTPQELEASMREWSEALDGITAEQMKRGISKCRETMDWPPTPSQFLKAAGVGSSGAPAHKAYKALPPPKCNPATARRQLAAMKAATRGPSPPITPWQEIHGMRAYA